MSGRLELIIGPMYAGKSTELVRIINRFKCLNKSVIVINNSLNNRYDSINLTTHNNQQIANCIVLSNLNMLEVNYKELFDKTNIIIIEELQFFSDAFECITKWCDVDNKYVIAAGLDGDFNRNPFGDVLRLIPHAESITKLTALCKKCGDGTEAIFSKRIVANKELQLVGSDDMYEACCRKHYNIKI